MKKKLKAIRATATAIGIAVLAQGLGSLAFGPLADATNADVTARTRVHVRTEPTTASQSLSVLAIGQTLPSHGSADGWTQVTYNGTTAYVASAYLTGGSSTSTQSRGTTQSSQGAVFSTATLNLRTGPGTNHAVGATVQRGTRLALTGTVSGDWAELTYGGKTYWAAARYLSATAASAYSSLPKATGKARGTVTLMVRTSSGSNYTNLGNVPAGTIFDVTGVRTNGMAQVIHNGAVRWVNAQYLTPVALETAPTVPSTPSTTTRYATTVLNIWAASTGTRYNGEIPRGGELQVTGIVENGRAQIVRNGEIRWVTARYVANTPPSSGGGASGGNSGNINKGYSSGLEKTNANVQAIAWDVWARFPQIKTQYGWRQDVTPDHPAGRAVDVMIPSYKSNQDLGWEIARYYRTNAQQFNINYIIFGQKIWSVARDREGWRPMASRGNDTANHYDHVHINTYG